MICFTTGRENVRGRCRHFSPIPIYRLRQPRNDQGPKPSRNESKKETAMSQAKGSWMTMAVLAGVLTFSSGVAAQTASPQTASPPAENAAPTADNAVMLTVFLKHDQSRPLSELNAQLQRQGYYKAFPPDGVEVVSWYVMMGVGQVVTLRLPASRLREVNRILENTAWGSYRTEFYPTYDYKAIGVAAHEKAQAQ
jgi:hypothetical protein